MTIYSMTGFARLVRQTPAAQFTLELKSVNHRFLDAQVTVPEAFSSLEFPLKNLLRENFSRGRVECFLRVQWFPTQKQGLPIDESLLNQLLETIGHLSQKCSSVGNTSALEVLKWPGIITQNLNSLEDLQKVILETFPEIIHLLKNTRAEEGKQTAQLIEARLKMIQAFAEEIQALLPVLLENQKQRLLKKFEEINLTLDPDRLAQEMVLFAQRSDVAEELGRLNIHLQSVKTLLTQGGNIGRKLDFMMQELNRETNTLGSKSISAEITQKVVAMKVCIEEMREQIQNIE